MNTTEETTKEKTTAEKMFNSGAHFGLPKARRHPTVKKYIYGLKQKFDIFDLEKTESLLDEAKAFAKKLGAERKKILFIGGKAESHRIVKNTAEKLEAPYCVGRWIGGSITNFTVIKKRVNKLKRLLEEKETDAHQKYTKLERLHIDREIAKLESMYAGLIPLGEKLPDAIFVVDPKREKIAVDEALSKKIPIIALANSDCDISKIDYPIVANDSTRKSIDYFVNEIADAYEDGLTGTPAQTTSEKPAA